MTNGLPLQLGLRFRWTEQFVSQAGSARTMPAAFQSRSILAAAGALVLSAGCSAVDSRSTDRFAATGQLIAMSGAEAGAANACFTCHGLDGRGDGAGSPRLAGMDAGYLERQLQAYADGRRQHQQMGWIAARLAPAERRAVASYYAGLPYPAALGQSRSAESDLYLHGDTSRGIPGCAACHGFRGEGVGPGNPALAGQPPAYLAGQLEQWRMAKRRNDPGEVMLRISRALSPAEALALSRYASALAGGPPSREPPAALQSAHRAATRSDAPGPPLHVPEAARAGR